MADNPRVDDILSEVVSENISQQKEETLEEMLSRHRKEAGNLRNKEMALKMQQLKGARPNKRLRRSKLMKRYIKILMKLKERQAEELASSGYSSTTSAQKGNLDNLVKATAGVSVTNHAEQSKPSKSVKRLEKRAQQEAAREQRIQEEQSQIVSDRLIENERLEQKLEPLGFTINEVKPDGHRLYRAVEDQLALHSGGSSPFTYQELRQMVADYMREHVSNFLPFFLSENMTDGKPEDSLSERFENYCREVEL